MDHNEALRSQACEKYLLGELPQAQRDAFEEHYFSCAECAAQLNSVAAFLSVSRDLLASVPVAAPAVTPVRLWSAWLRPAFAVPVLALLLAVIGYQNFVTIPHYKQAASPRVLPMYSLVAGNSRGAERSTFTSAPGQPLGLYVDIPADPSHSVYTLRLEEPTGHSTLLRQVTAEEAQRTQVVVVNPGTQAGNYTIVISGLANGSPSPLSAEELARLQFVIELR